jgi:hypothetical protein
LRKSAERRRPIFLNSKIQPIRASALNLISYATPEKGRIFKAMTEEAVGPFTSNL